MSKEKREMRIVPAIYEAFDLIPNDPKETMTLSEGGISVQVPDDFVQEMVNTYFDGYDRINYIMQEIGYDFQNALEFALEGMPCDEEGFPTEDFDVFIYEGHQPYWKLTVETPSMDEPATHIYGVQMAELFRKDIQAELLKRARAEVKRAPLEREHDGFTVTPRSTV